MGFSLVCIFYIFYSTIALKFHQYLLFLNQSFTFSLRKKFCVLVHSCSDIFELDLPCFELVLLFFLTFSIFTQFFPFTESVLPFFESDLTCFVLVLLVFLSQILSILTQPSLFSHLFSRSFHFLSYFFRVLRQPFSVFKSAVPDLQKIHTFRVNCSYSFDSDLPCFNDFSTSHIFIVSLLLVPILCSDFIYMYIVDNVKNGAVFRKCLLHYYEQKIDIVLSEKLIKKTLTDKQEREKNKIR